MRTIFHSFTVFLLFFNLVACGSEGGPVVMATSATAVVGELTQGASVVLSAEEGDLAALSEEALTALADLLENPLQTLTNSEESSSSGTLTAQITQDFPNRRSIVIENFNIEMEFANVGMVRFTLNPNLESTGTIFKLNRDNEPFGEHNMILNLVVETAEQNLTYDNVMVASETATLTLTQALPILSFEFAGTTMQLQTLALSVVVPASLITSDFDPN